MSKSGQAPDAVVEWSPTHSVVLNVSSGSRRSSAELGDAVQILNGQREVVAAVSRRSAFVRAIRVPDTNKIEVAQILRMQLAGLFPVPENELSYDFRLTSDVDHDGRLAVVGAMRESDLLKLHADARANGLRVKRVLPAAFGSMILAKELGLPTCAVVQQTSEGIAIDVIADGELRYSRVTPALDIEAIEGEVARTFAAAGVAPGPIVATEGLHLPGAIDARTTTLAALGTAGADSLDVNLEPAEVAAMRVKRRESGRARLAILLCTLSVVLATVVYIDRSDKQARVDKLNAATTRNLNRLRSELENETKDANAAGALRKAIHQAFEPGQSLGDVLSISTNAAPAGVWLNGVTLERGKVMLIRGTSMTSQAITTFLDQLQAASVDFPATDAKHPARTVARLRDVKLVFANNGKIEETAVQQFSISAFPVGNVPVSEPKKKGAKK